jgi:hypothetical protein
MRLYPEWLKMPDIACQDYQAMALGCRCDHHVGKARCLTLSTSEVRQRARYARCRQIEGQDTGRIEMQQRIQPSCQIARFAGGAISLCFGDAILDFGDGHDREEQLVGMCIYPGD